MRSASERKRYMDHVSDAGRIVVEVVYATLRDQRLVTLSLEKGATVGDAIRASGLMDAFPEIDPERTLAGIFGRRYPPDHTLSAGDRVEIYRPLRTDPKVGRRERAARMRQPR